MRPLRALGRAPFLLVIALVLAVPLGAPGSTLAAPAERFDEERIELAVGRLESRLGVVRFHARFSREAPPQELGLWRPGADPDTDPPVFLADPDRAPRYRLEGSLLQATVPLIELESGEPAGEATVVAELTPVGDREPVEVRDRQGNVWNRQLGWTQRVTWSGSIGFPGGISFGFRDVEGSVSVIETFRTQPDARIVGETYSLVVAFVEDEQGFALLVVVLESRGYGFAEVLFVPADAERPVLIGSTELHGDDLLGAEFDIPLRFSPEPAHVRVSLARTPEREVYKLRQSAGVMTVVEEVLRPQGSLRFPDGVSFDLASATATLVDSHLAVTNPDGGRPAGDTPVNDRPSGAVPLAPGDEVKGVWTGGASAAPEETFAHDLGYTLWYRIEGHGGEVTLDTGGSDFDTAIHLYRATESGLEFVGDADDQFIGRTMAARDLQAEMTFAAEPGVTYYAQVGGTNLGHTETDAERGRLTVTVTASS